MPLDRVDLRRIIEALRSGVPTRAAVEALGGGQPALERRFDDLLKDVSGGRTSEHRGFVFNGGFGAGKSHLLESFAARALLDGFVVSRATISRGLPLHASAAVLFELITNTETRHHHDDALLNIVADAVFDARRDLSELRLWLRAEVDAGRLAPIFPATLRALNELNWGASDLSTIIEYWSGASVPASELNRIVRVYASHISGVRPPAQQRADQTIRFLSQLFIHLGFRGWIVLFDELELIRLQATISRGKAYAEIATWFGLGGANTPGLGVVGAITPDFADSMISSAFPGMRDLRYVPERFEQNARNFLLVDQAIAGMEFLQQMQDLTCRTHNKTELQRMQRTVREIYEGAFECASTEWPVQTSGASELRSVRAHIRRWITQWDLERQHRTVDVAAEGISARPDDHDDLDDLSGFD